MTHSLSHGVIPSMPMTESAMACAAPVLPADFERCRVPGGIDLWSRGGFYSPGVCFISYRALCTQSTASSDGWPHHAEETVVRCVPEAYECNADGRDQRFATSDLAGTVLSVPAFEIRWRDVNLHKAASESPAPLTSHTPLSSDFATVSETYGPGTVTASLSTSDVVFPTAPATAVGHGYTVAIAVGVVVGLVASVVLGFCIKRYLWKGKKEPQPAALEGSAECRASEPLTFKETEPAEMASIPIGPCELQANSLSHCAPRPTSAAHLSGPFEMAVSETPNNKK
ncbi:hypothetical protein CP533_0387 [Ophiocordyceps camponoti-saundersi (nom. inval.)]|nr:hypothetical protein CP533_0387 [Ophiocordyceps camponoti-saundersi (nom. inval.)]